MRSLPFRVIFLCGLGEGRFPAAGAPDPLDLTRLEPRVGDVNPRERDKYLFLETLICARDRLYLSYVNRDAQTGDPLEPSPVVSELMRHLDRSHNQPSKVWINELPLRRYDIEYFSDAANTDSGGPPNFSPAAWKESCARRLRDSLRGHLKETPQLTPVALRQLNPSLVNWLGLCPIDGHRARTEPSERVAISFRDLLGFLRIARSRKLGPADARSSRGL